MQRNDFFKLKTSDDFQKAFDAFQSSANFDRLQEKFRLKPFFERNRLLSQVTQFSSYFLNIFSVSTAFFCVFAFLSVILHAYIAIVFAVVGLALIEALKRLMIPGFFQRFFQFKKVAIGSATTILLLIGLSVTLSYKGASEAIFALTASPVLIDIDSLQAGFAERIADLEEQKADLKKTATWKGAYTKAGATSFQQYNERIAALEEEASQQAQTAHTANNASRSEHLKATGLKAEYFALAALLFDLLLVLALAYCEYYDFRSLAEFSEVEASAEPPVQNQKADLKKFSENGHAKQPPAQEHEQRNQVRGFSQDNASRNASRNVGACENCGTSFTKKTSWQRFCSEPCRIAKWEKKSGKRLNKSF